MMKITTILKLGILGSLGALMACAKPAPSLVTENSVNLSRYVGTWYEQARLPNRFQKECVADTVAEYALNAQGQLHVVNQCQLMDGSTIIANGVGRVNRSVEPQDTAKLQVRFAPAWLGFLSMVWGDYWIMRIEGDYDYSLVGTPDRKYLWVLSRTKQADPSVVEALLQFAEEQDFDIDVVIRH